MEFMRDTNGKLHFGRGHPHTDDEIVAAAQAKSQRDLFGSLKKIYAAQNLILPDVEVMELAAKMYFSRAHYRKKADAILKKRAEELHRVEIRTAAMKKTEPATGKPHGNGIAGDSDELMSKMFNEMCVLQKIMEESLAVSKEMLAIERERLELQKKIMNKAPIAGATADGSG